MATPGDGTGPDSSYANRPKTAGDIMGMIAGGALMLTMAGGILGVIGYMIYSMF